MERSALKRLDLYGMQKIIIMQLVIIITNRITINYCSLGAKLQNKEENIFIKKKLKRKMTR